MTSRNQYDKYAKSPEFKEIIEDLAGLIDLSDDDEVAAVRAEMNEYARDIFDVEFDADEYIDEN